MSEEGVVSNLKAEVVECVASTLDSPPLSSNKVEVETIANRRYKELHDMIARKQEEIMNQTVQKINERLWVQDWSIEKWNVAAKERKDEAFIKTITSLIFSWRRF